MVRCSDKGKKLLPVLNLDLGMKNWSNRSRRLHQPQMRDCHLSAQDWLFYSWLRCFLPLWAYIRKTRIENTDPIGKRTCFTLIFSHFPFSYLSFHRCEDSSCGWLPRNHSHSRLLTVSRSTPYRSTSGRESMRSIYQVNSHSLLQMSSHNTHVFVVSIYSQLLYLR